MFMEIDNKLNESLKDTVGNKLNEIIKTTVETFDSLCITALEKHLQRKATIEDYKECTLIVHNTDWQGCNTTKLTLLLYKNIKLGTIQEELLSYYDTFTNNFRAILNMSFIPENI